MHKKIEVVSHCWAVKHLHYADALCYQISSLLKIPAPIAQHATLTICMSHRDENTSKVLAYFASLPKHFKIKLIPLEIQTLGRRAIGRNLAALSTDADIVWFSDVDQTFEENILGRLMELEWPEGAEMIWPQRIMIHKNHELGDKALEAVGGDPKIIVINPEDFSSKKYGRAIGGVQIVRGDFARQHGYLKGTKWVQPIKSKKFLACWCDRKYRDFVRKYGDIVAVDLPGLYRLRHSEAGHGRKPKVRT